MGPLEVELGDHGLIGVVQRDQLVALIGERGPRGPEVLRHLLLPVVYLARGDDLVPGMVEGAHRDVEPMDVLGLHVLTHGGLAARPQLGVAGPGHCAASSIGGAPKAVSASGSSTDPSSCCPFSSSAMIVRELVTAVPLSVCSGSGFPPPDGRRRMSSRRAW